MKKTFTILIAAIAAILMMAQPMKVMADNWSYTFNASSGISKGNNTLNNVTWNIVHDSEYENNEAAGYHVGSSSKTVSYLQLSTSGISGTISEIVVNAKGNGSGGTISVSVGGNAFSESSGNTDITNSFQDFVFTGEDDGEIIIRLAYNSALKKNFYVASITVTYTTGSGAASTTTTISNSGITNTDVYVGTAAGSLSATVKDNNNTTISGASVTWSSDNDDVATIDASTGAVTLVAAGNVTFTASYAGVSGTYQASSGTYEMTVTSSAPQPTDIEINMNYQWLGSNNGSNLNANQLPVIKTNDNVTTTIAKGTSTTNPRGDSDYIRLYNGSTLTFDAPEDYEIIEIVFTTGGNNTWNEPSVSGTFDNSTKTWSGQASSVVFTMTGSCFISKVEITLEAEGSAVATTTTISDSGITNTDVYVGTAAGSLSATVKDNNNTTISGASVTWSGDNDDVATIDASTGAVTLVAAGNVTFTASYAGVSGTYLASHDTYEMTVTSSAPYVQPTDIEINMNYQWLGSNNGNNLNANQLPVIKTNDNVTTTIAKGTSTTNPRGDSDYIRLYNGSTLTFDAPEDYEIIEIVFTTGGNNTWNEPSVSGTFDNSTKTWSGQASSVVFTMTGSCFISKVEITLEAEGSAVATTTTISDSGITNTDLHNGTAAGALTASVTETVSGNPVSGATVTWTSSNTNVATIDNGVVTLGAVGTTTITANYAGVEDVYKPSSATYELTVSDSYAPGTQNNPYTVAQARAAIDAGTGITGVYATGVVTAIPTEWSTQHSNITFNFVDNPGDTEFLQAYRCISTANADASTVAVGDVVVVSGNLKKFGATYEFDAACQLVSLTKPSVALPTFSPAAGTYTAAQNVTISCTTANSTIYYTTDGSEPTSSSTQYNGAISVSTTTTIKAIAYVGTTSGPVATASYHFCSAENPYTVTQALAFLDYPANGIYVTGKVSTAPTQEPTNYGQLTYYISVDGTTANQLKVYKGKGLENAAFENQDDIQVGDIVTIYGNVDIYDNETEFAANNYLVSFERPYTTFEYEIIGYGNDQTVKNGWYLIASPVDYTLAGQDMVSGTDYDLYRFNPTADLEWENYKNSEHSADFTALEVGRGYLYANANDITLSFTGVPASTGEVTAAYTGWNLIGNPLGTPATVDKDYYRMNDTHDGIMTTTGSGNVAVLEGIFVQANAQETVTFTAASKGVRSNEIKSVVLNVMRNNNVIDRAIARLNSDRQMTKFQLFEGDTKIYFPMEDADYAIVSSDGHGTMPVNFKAKEMGRYTISVETEGIDMSYLHLIDRLTGEDIDLLLDSKYSFIASNSDMESRFILSFGESSINASNETFAFQSGSDIIVNGEGELQIFDVMGRMVKNTTINGVQTVNVKSQGVYIFKLNEKTQKIIVR